MFLNQWEEKNPRTWTQFDILNWLIFWAYSNNVDSQELKEILNNVKNGFELCNKSYEFFNEKTKFGSFIFEDLHLLISSFDINRKQRRNELKKIKRNKPEKIRICDFICDLLKNPTFNPSIIKWKNYEEKIFVIVDRNEVSRLWGETKNKKNMTYEKLSRTLRYNYKSNLVIPHHQPLTYKFGIFKRNI